MNIQEKNSFMQKGIVVWLGALLCCALWGSAFPSIKIGYKLFLVNQNDVATQILFAGMRFTLAGLLTIIFGCIINKKVLLPKKQSYGKIFKLSLLQTLSQYVFFYVGLANTTGVKASIIEGFNVFISILVASLIFHQENLNLKKVLGSIVGFIGVILVNMTGEGLNFSFKFNGEGFILISTIAYAFSSVLIKDYSKYESPVTLSGYQFAVGGIIMIIIGVLFGGKISITNIGQVSILLYLAFISAMAYSLWGILLKFNSVSRVTVFGFMNPVFGVILSTILLKETQAVSLLSVIALIMVCCGIYIVNKDNN